MRRARSRSSPSLVDRYALRYVEDPFEEEDYASFAALTAAVGRKDDRWWATTFTPPRRRRFQVGLDQKASNGPS